MKGFFKLNLKKKIEVEKFYTFFDSLELDENDARLYALKPFRKRKIFYARYENNELKALSQNSFKQNVNDERSKARKFSILVPTKQELLLLKNLTETVIADSSRKLPHIPKKFNITFHFVQIIASKKGETNSPEGIHRDGFDLLFPCIVIARKNIKGGVSRMFSKINDDFKLINSEVIKEGECLVVDEKHFKDLYHDVSPIYLVSKKIPGYRNIIGLDINF